MRLRKIAAIPLLCAAVSLAASGATAPANPGPVKVEIRKNGDQYQLLVNHQPLYIKGAGIEFGNPEKLAQHGGNSFRTWRTENGKQSGQEVLDRALTNHLYVTMGIELGTERHGFDYNDPAAVQQQFDSVQAQVLKYKDHPALIIWCIGNELNLSAHNPKVWNAVNDISRMIHRLDTNHLTMTALSGLSRPLVNDLKSRAPDLDLIGIQMYADIVNLPRYLHEAAWTGPYIVSEWGATGYWEVPKTAWGAPIENDSTTKAEFYRKRFETAIQSDPRQCIGSYVFLWEQKQERTPTWFGMFLETGEETAAVDVMHYLWNGAWPSNRSPRLQTAQLNGKTARDSIYLKPNQSCTARIVATDETQPSLTYYWEIMEESTERSIGGDKEDRPPAMSGLIEDSHKSEIALKAPSKPGAYRLFTYAFDGKGHAAHANIPFYVEEQPPTVARNTGE
ncbi:MAG: glycoside hydrolase family 2 TIM barrel-domain containing protein [Verrucomicrobiota bacterium]